MTTKKPLNPLVHAPTASSSEDDEVETSSGESEEGSSSEEDEPKVPPASVTTAVPGKPIVPATAVPGKPTVSATATKQESDSDSGSGSEAETESDSEAEEASKTGSAKAIAAKNPKKKEVLSAGTLALPTVKSGTKRAGEGTSRDGKAKRAKKDTSGEDNEKKTGEDTKKSAFQRLWSEDDEIALLQGLINFEKETGKSPYEDTNQFYDYVKKSISFAVTKNQMVDKRRSLKNKYIGKGKNGKQVSFSKPHDVKAVALLKSIWGPEGVALKSNGISKKSHSKMKKLESVKQDLFSSVPNVGEGDRKVLNHGGELEMSNWFENSFVVRSIAAYGVDERTVIQGWRSMAVEDKKKIEEEMKALRAKEIEYMILKTQFLSEAVSMLSEVIKQRCIGF